MPRALTTQELIALVDRALNNEGSYDDLFNEAVFGGSPPKMWGDWPQHAREDWDAGASLLLETKRQRRGGGREESVEIEAAWHAVLDSIDAEDPWRRLTWGDIGQRLGISATSAAYQVRDVYGFKFDGKPPNRIIVLAPCAGCFHLSPADKMTGPFCAQCVLEFEADEREGAGLT